MSPTTLKIKSHWRSREASHFCDSSGTIAMNHRTRSRVESLELAGNEKSRLEELAILFPRPRLPYSSTLHTPATSRNSSRKSEPQSGDSSWLERRIFHTKTGFVGISPFDFLPSNPSTPRPHGDSLRYASLIPPDYEANWMRTRRRSIRKVKLLGEINYLLIRGFHV